MTHIYFGKVSFETVGFTAGNGHFTVTDEDKKTYERLFRHNSLNQDRDQSEPAVLEVSVSHTEKGLLTLKGDDTVNLETADDFTLAAQLIESAEYDWKPAHEALQHALLQSLADKMTFNAMARLDFKTTVSSLAKLLLQ